MNLFELQGKRVAVLLTEDEGSSIFFAGTAFIREKSVFIYSQSCARLFEVKKEWCDRVRLIPAARKGLLLDADVLLWLPTDEFPVLDTMEVPSFETSERGVLTWLI